MLDIRPPLGKLYSDPLHSTRNPYTLTLGSQGMVSPYRVPSCASMGSGHIVSEGGKYSMTPAFARSPSTHNLWLPQLRFRGPRSYKILCPTAVDANVPPTLYRRFCESEDRIPTFDRCSWVPTGLIFKFCGKCTILCSEYPPILLPMDY